MINDIKKWPCLLFWIGLSSLYSYWTWTAQLNDLGGDSAIYLLTAQHWSIFGAENVAAAQIASTSTYPPLYPLLLAMVAAATNWLVAHQVTAFCAVASLFVLWCWLRAEGLSLIDSLCAVIALALVPGIYLQALYLQSEFLFLLFVVICLYFISRLEREAKQVFLVVASIAAACACLTRSAGLSMVAALVVYAVWHRPKREWPVVLVLGVAPVCAWSLFGQPAGSGYLAAWSERLTIVGAVSAVDILKLQFIAFADGFQQNFAGEGSSNITTVLLLWLACFAAWIRRLLLGKLDALFLGAYFTIVLAWPFPAERVRFILPAVPIFFAQLLLVLHDIKLMRTHRNSLIASRAATALLAITMLPSLLLNMHRHLEPMPNELEVHRRNPVWYGSGSEEERLTSVFDYGRRQAGFEELQGYVPLDACIYSIKPSLVGLFAQRRSYRTPLPGSSLAKFPDTKTIQCRYVQMMPYSNPTFSEPYYPLASWTNAMDVVHITWLIPSDETGNIVSILGKIR